MAIGLYQAGWRGVVAAWCGFTLPSAIALVLFAYGVDVLARAGSGWLHGLKVVAVVIVAQAVWGMAKSLCPDRPRATVAVLSALLVLFVPSAYGQVAAIILAGIFGWRRLKTGGDSVHAPLPLKVGRRTAIACLALFFTLLALLPVAHGLVPSHAVALIDSFYRSGALVFGGGHVVLPLLQAEVIPPGWISNELFLAGYGAAQAVPGPLFAFAAYLGAAQGIEPNRALGAAICLFSIYLPSFLLLIGALPFWEVLRTRQSVRSALAGVNAAVVGLLLAALYEPVWTSAIRQTANFALGLVAFLLLQMWKVPPWLVVVLTALGGALLALR